MVQVLRLALSKINELEKFHVDLYKLRERVAQGHGRSKGCLRFPCPMKTSVVGQGDMALVERLFLFWGGGREVREVREKAGRGKLGRLGRFGRHGGS